MDHGLFCVIEISYLNEAYECGVAAAWLCEYVRENYRIPLMTEVIIDRELLALNMKTGNKPAADILDEFNGRIVYSMIIQQIYS